MKDMTKKFNTLTPVTVITLDQEATHRTLNVLPVPVTIETGAGKIERTEVSISLFASDPAEHALNNIHLVLESAAALDNLIDCLTYQRVKIYGAKID
jgi:hypothetical protein